jgi:hypothetical protein
MRQLKALNFKGSTTLVDCTKPLSTVGGAPTRLCNRLVSNHISCMISFYYFIDKRARVTVLWVAPAHERNRAFKDWGCQDSANVCILALRDMSLHYDSYGARNNFVGDV